jgi:hypothetical protein
VWVLSDSATQDLLLSVFLLISQFNLTNHSSGEGPEN